jgi:hypothetical protein
MGTNVWMYRDALRSDTQRDLVGYSVHATDGDLGKIDQATTETSRNYLVVDTGFWIFGKKRLIPAGVVTRIDHAIQEVQVAMTKDQIKQAPDFDESMTSDDEAYYEKYGSYYGRFGW